MVVTTFIDKAMKYVIKAKNPPPPDLIRKIIEAHVAAIQAATQRSVTDDDGQVGHPE